MIVKHSKISFSVIHCSSVWGWRPVDSFYKKESKRNAIKNGCIMGYNQ